LFADAPAEPKPAAAAYRINIDGGSRGNPGPAAYGVIIRDGSGEIVAKLKKYIGRMTNNVAEYYGLIAALDYAESHSVKTIRIESDSELLVKQMRGQYKVKSEDLRPLFERALKMSKAFETFASKTAKPMPSPTKRWMKRKRKLPAEPRQRKPLRPLLNPNRPAPRLSRAVPNRSREKSKRVFAVEFYIFSKMSNCQTAWSLTFPFTCGRNHRFSQPLPFVL
jgi:ribonuclease HI